MNDHSPPRGRAASGADEDRAERARQWKEENAAAIAQWNAWVRENGLPLARYRKF